MKGTRTLHVRVGRKMAPHLEYVIPAEQAVSKPHPREATAPEIVIPAKAGIQAGWSGGTPRSAPPGPLDSRFRGNDVLAFRAPKLAF